MMWLSIASIAGIVCLSVVMLCNIIVDFPIAKCYANAVDTRKEYVLKKRDEGHSGVLEIEKIKCPMTWDAKSIIFKLCGKSSPKSAIYYYSDVENEPNDYSIYVRKAYRLEFDIKLKQASNE